MSNGWAAPLEKDRQGRWIFPQVYFTAKKGDWSQARNWRNDTPPTEALTRINIEGGTSVTLNKAVNGDMALLFLGSGKRKDPASLILKDGAKLSVGGLWMPNGVIPGSVATVSMEGGQLSIAQVKDHTYFLDVGFGGTTSGTATFALSGGKLIVGFDARIGNDAPDTNAGTFSVQSTLPDCAFDTSGARGITVFASGTLAFVLDEKGVSPIKADKGRIALRPGSVLHVDASAYRGGTKAIVLAQANSIVKDSAAKVQLVGLNAPLKGDIVFEKNRIVLKITRGG